MIHPIFKNILQKHLKTEQIMENIPGYDKWKLDNYDDEQEAREIITEEEE